LLHLLRGFPRRSASWFALCPTYARRRWLPRNYTGSPQSAYFAKQTEEPLITGHALFGAVMSEQAVRTTAAMMAMAVKSLLRVMGVLLIREGRGCGELNTPNVPLVENAEMSFSYQKMYVSYQKQYFSYHLPSRCGDFATSFLGL